MRSKSFKYWPEVIGVALAILVLLLSSCAPEDRDSYYSDMTTRYQYCIDVEGKTYFVKDFSRRYIRYKGKRSIEFTDIEGVDYSFNNVSYCERRIPTKPIRHEEWGSDLVESVRTYAAKPTRCAACGSDITGCGNPHPVKPIRCEACGSDLTGRVNPIKPVRCAACGSDLTGKEPPQPVKPIKCEACGSDLTGKEHTHAR